jgi:hypothetical protein
MAFDKPGKPDPPSRKSDSTPSGHFLARQGQRYWSDAGTNRGKVAGIDWGTPGDFAECVTRVTPHLGAGARGYCNRRHVEATGFPPGKAPGEGGK